MESFSPLIDNMRVNQEIFKELTRPSVYQFSVSFLPLHLTFPLILIKDIFLLNILYFSSQYYINWVAFLKKHFPCPRRLQKFSFTPPNNPHNPFPIQLPLSEQHKRERTKLEMRILVSTAVAIEAPLRATREWKFIYEKLLWDYGIFQPRAPLLSSSSSCLRNATMYISIISECKQASSTGM